LMLTVQRQVSYVLVGTAVAGLSAGAAFVIAAIVKDSEASDLYAVAKYQNIDRPTLDQYVSARDTRSDMIGASVGTIFLSVAVGAAAAFTYSFDSSSRSTGGPVRKEARLSATPLPGGGIVSLGLGF
jgi:hypothetical protein